MLKLLFDTIFFWCRVCFAVFLGQQMLCFVGETPYWYRTVFVCFVLYHVCLVSCLFRYVWFAVFVGQRMSCFEGETLFCCKICLFVDAFFGTVFVRRLFILASCCLRLCWFDSQCLFRCVFWVNGCYVLRERETLYCCRTVCPLASRTWKQFWWKGQPERKILVRRTTRKKNFLVRWTTGKKTILVRRTTRNKTIMVKKTEIKKYWWKGQPERKQYLWKKEMKNIGEKDNRKENNIGEKKTEIKQYWWKGQPEISSSFIFSDCIRGASTLQEIIFFSLTLQQLSKVIGCWIPEAVVPLYPYYHWSLFIWAGISWFQIVSEWIIEVWGWG